MRWCGYGVGLGSGVTANRQSVSMPVADGKTRLPFTAPRSRSRHLRCVAEVVLNGGGHPSAPLYTSFLTLLTSSRLGF